LAAGSAIRSPITTARSTMGSFVELLDARTWVAIETPQNSWMILAFPSSTNADVAEVSLPRVLTGAPSRSGASVCREVGTGNYPFNFVSHVWGSPQRAVLSPPLLRLRHSSFAALRATLSQRSRTLLAQSSCQGRYALMVFEIIPECRSAFLLKEHSASPETPLLLDGTRARRMGPKLWPALYGREPTSGLYFSWL
jgi:hypothetical protein